MRADARRRIVLYSSQLAETGSEPLGLVPSFSVENRNSLACLPGSKGKKGNSLACLRNAGFHFAESYCSRTGEVLSHKSDWLTPPWVGLARTHLLGSAVVSLSIYYATGDASE